MRGFHFYNCTLVTKDNAVIGTTDCKDIKNITKIGNRIVIFDENGLVIEIKKFQKFSSDQLKIISKNKKIKLLRPGNYRVISSGFQPPKPISPHPLTHYIKKGFYDVNVHSQDAFTGYTSKKLSMKGNNVALISITKHSTHNNIKLVFYNDENPNKEENHKIWVELQENNRLTVFNPVSRKSIQTIKVPSSGMKDTGELFEFGFYVCKEISALLIFSGVEYLNVKRVLGVFVDPVFGDVRNVDYHKKDTYGLTINALKSVMIGYEKFEMIGKLKAVLKQDNENIVLTDVQDTEMKCPNNKKKYRNKLIYRCNRKKNFEATIYHVNFCEYDMKIESWLLCPIKYNFMDDMDFSKTLCLVDNEENKPFIEGIRRHGLNDIKSN